MEIDKLLHIFKSKLLLLLIWAVGCLFSAHSISQELRYRPPLKAVTSFTVIADIAKNIGKDLVIVESITKPGTEIHGYEPTPQDIVRTKKADVVLWNGLNLEQWFSRFLQDLGDVPNVVVSEGIQPLSIYEGPYTGKPNPHAWMSISNALVYIKNILKTFSTLDPDNAHIYERNANTYIEKLKSLRTELSGSFKSIPSNQRYLVTTEGAFSYLAKDFNLQEIYLWPINSDQQGTPQQVRKVIDMIKKYKIPVIFSESTISDKPAKQIALESGTHYGGVLYVDSLSEENGPVPTYFDLLRVTIKTIGDAFNQHTGKLND